MGWIRPAGSEIRILGAAWPVLSARTVRHQVLRAAGGAHGGEQGAAEDDGESICIELLVSTDRSGEGGMKGGLRNVRVRG